MYIFGYKTTVFIQNLYILVKFFGKNFIFSVKSTNLLVFQDQMYIFGYKTPVFIQNLYILVKLFLKNFIFSVKSTIFFFVTKCTFLGTKLQFLSKISTFWGYFFGKNFIFRVKRTNCLVFHDKMYIFGYKATVFIQNLYILTKFFGKNFIFSVKSTIFLFFRDQMCIVGYKATVFIQNLYILVKFFWQKLHY